MAAFQATDRNIGQNSLNQNVLNRLEVEIDHEGTRFTYAGIIMAVQNDVQLHVPRMTTYRKDL